MDKNEILLNFIVNLQRWVFSFLLLCSNFYIGYKANVVEGRLLLGFDNAFVFALYSRKFSPFTRYTPFVVFLNGRYNFVLRGFLSESTTLSHPFFRCSLILIFGFFLQWQWTQINSILSSWQWLWHSLSNCSHSSRVYVSTKTVLFIFTFSIIMFISSLSMFPLFY